MAFSFQCMTKSTTIKKKKTQLLKNRQGPQIQRREAICQNSELPWMPEECQEKLWNL